MHRSRTLKVQRLTRSLRLPARAGARLPSPACRRTRWHRLDASSGRSPHDVTAASPVGDETGLGCPEVAPRVVTAPSLVSPGRQLSPGQITERVTLREITLSVGSCDHGSRARSRTDVERLDMSRGPEDGTAASGSPTRDAQAAAGRRNLPASATCRPSPRRQTPTGTRGRREGLRTAVPAAGSRLLRLPRVTVPRPALSRLGSSVSFRRWSGVRWGCRPRCVRGRAAGRTRRRSARRPPPRRRTPRRRPRGR